MGIRATWLFASLLTVSSATLADGWGGSFALTSDYILRGVSQSDGSPAVQGDVHFRSPAGWGVGVWGSTVKLSRGEPTSGELDWFAGFSGPLNADWSGRIELVHYSFPINRQIDGYDYDEIIAGLSFRDAFQLNVAYSPDYDRYSYYGLAKNLAAYSADLGWHQPVIGALTVAAGVGFYRLEDPAHTQYPYWSAGLSYPYRAFRLDVTYIGAGEEARSLFYSYSAYNEAAGHHWSATVLWRF